MSCPHGLTSQPATCSQCQGAPARRVTVAGGDVLVDGEVVGRNGEGDIPEGIAEARQRGAQATKRKYGGLRK